MTRSSIVPSGRAAFTRLRATAGRLRRKASGVRADADFESRLVWILGSPRSGSTWLLQLLGEHEAVVPINEPLIGWYLGPFLSDLPGWSTGSLDSGNFTMTRVQRDKPDQFFAREFTDVWQPALGKLMRERFLAHALRYPAGVPQSRALVVIKEPNGSQSADVIMAALPRSRFLFLLRDGRDVVDSELAANRTGSWVSKEFRGAGGIGQAERYDFVTQSAHKWLWRTQVVQDAYGAHPGPKAMLRYEDLRHDPITHLRSLLDWLELDIGESQLATMIEQHAFERIPDAARGSEAFFRAASPGLWRENLSADEQAAVNEIIGAKLRELGYEG